MANRSDLRRWLEKQPRPASVRGYDADGDERMVRISTARSKFSDAEAALGACITCEALDAEGAVLRVYEGHTASSSRGGSKNPSETNIAELARIIADASDKAALRHADAYRLAYEQQVQLVKILSERLAGLEKAWHRLVMSLPESSGGTDATNEGLIQQIIAAHAMQAMSGGEEPTKQ